MKIIELPVGCTLWYNEETGALYVANEVLDGYISQVRIGTCDLKNPATLDDIAKLAPIHPHSLDMAAEGEKVIYLDENGYEGDRQCARHYFPAGTVLTVKRIKIGRSSSTYEFQEFPGNHFNTVMFKPVK